MKFVAILVGLGVTLGVLFVAAYGALEPDPADYVLVQGYGLNYDDYIADTQGYEAAKTGAQGMAQIFVSLVLVGALMLVMKRISYRPQDAFFALIPIYGIVFTIMAAWRVASLPNRYWSPRPDEVMAAAQIGGPNPWGLGPPPGMYPDPWYPGHYRFWNGVAWADMPQRVSTTPPPPPPPGY